MAREKATVTIDRNKLETAKALIRVKSISETIDVALDRLIRAEQLRRAVAAYARQPFTEVALGREAGLAHKSVANFDNTFLLSRRRLIRRLGRADRATMEAACRALATATGCSV